MKISYLLLILTLLSCKTFSQADSVYFTGELRWRLNGKNNGELGGRVPFREYFDVHKYRINRLFITDRPKEYDLNFIEEVKSPFWKKPEIQIVY